MALRFYGDTFEGSVSTINPLIDLGTLRVTLCAATATGCIHGVFLNLALTYPLFQHAAHGLWFSVKMDTDIRQGGIASL